MTGQETHSAPITAPSYAGGTDGRIDCVGLVRIYKSTDIEVVALQGLDLHVNSGELITIVGASGSGKSTLMNVLGGLDRPTAGRATVAGNDLMDMDGATRTRYRRDVIGFVWQDTARNLVPYLDARGNVELPMALAGTDRRERRERAERLLDVVGLGQRSRHRPGELSGGEQQRVAIAVALANEPKVLLADEPTGELDSETAGEIFGVLRTVNQTMGVTGVIVTHDPLVSIQVDRTVTIRDGRISSETLRDRSQAEGDLSRVISREYSVLDSAGRLQLPEHYVEALELQRRVRLELEPDHIGVWPEQSAPNTEDSGEQP
jgi:ABC-type lipoprotein export system ATPase subunit